MEQISSLEDLKSGEVVVSGRKFHAMSDTSFEQDIYIMGIMEETGLQELASEFDMLKDDLSDMSRKVIIKAFASGRLFDLLGAVMEEESVPWTLHQAKVNGKFFAGLKNMDDKNALKASVVSVILGFFVSGLLSSKISQKSSTVSLEMLPQSIGPSVVS